VHLSRSQSLERSCAHFPAKLLLHLCKNSQLEVKLVVQMKVLDMVWLPRGCLLIGSI